MRTLSWRVLLASPEMLVPGRCCRMAVRAATAKVEVPGSVVALMKLLSGVPGAPPPPLSFGKRCQKYLTMRFLGHAGLTNEYFGDEFLVGARHSLTYVTSLVSPAVSSSLIDPRLAGVFSEAADDLEKGGLSLEWDVEEVTGAELRGLHLVFGLRRRDLPAPRNALQADFAGHRIVLREPGQPAVADFLKSLQYGVTLGAEAVITCKQTMTLREGDQVVAHTFDAETVHLVRLEAELNEKSLRGDEGKRQLMFNEERGWSIADLNGVFDGNCVTEGVKPWVQGE